MTARGQQRIIEEDYQMIYLKCNYQLLNVQYSSSFLFHLFEVFFSVGSKSPLCPHVSVVLVMNIILPKGAT